ncbi:hypothetical protein EMCRGX_G028318 [Ephydatia muelleri]
MCNTPEQPAGIAALSNEQALQPMVTPEQPAGIAAHPWLLLSNQQSLTCRKRRICFECFMLTNLYSVEAQLSARMIQVTSFSSVGQDCSGCKNSVG